MILGYAITAIATLGVATFIYTWQKELEYKYLLRREKRIVYRQLHVDIETSLQFAMVLGKNERETSVAIKDLRASLMSVALFGDHDISNSIQNLINDIVDVGQSKDCLIRQQAMVLVQPKIISLNAMLIENLERTVPQTRISIGEILRNFALRCKDLFKNNTSKDRP